MENSPPPKLNQPRRGFLDRKKVRAFTFYTVSSCIGFSVIVCILAIWDFAKDDVFWRVLATFIVIALGAAIFAIVNSWFGEKE